ncbi:MAG: orotate phosphoribosyltransferase [Saprospiraceae bacterium]|nr:orotate phosphoribosyltransferase [Saprospiraceae bacterium]
MKEPETLTIAEEIALELLQIKAIKLSPERPFTWASGIQSPVYCDNRLLLSYPSTRNKVIDAFVEVAPNHAPFDYVAGVATAGIAFGALLASRLKLPFVYIRSKAKGHGRENQIEGHLKPGAKCLVVEDLISTGGSSLKAVDALRAANAEVKAVVAVFSYGFDKASQAFEEAGCPFETLSNYNILIQEASKQNYIHADQIETLTAWRRNPMDWSSK